MRHLNVLRILQKMDIVPLEHLQKELFLSDRSIRTLLKELKNDGKKYGFIILTQPKKGYVLKVENTELFQQYQEKQLFLQNEHSGHKHERVPKILFFLLQQVDYISLQKIADLLGVSRNTIIQDLPEVRNNVMLYHLELDAKSHYGIKITGKEIDYRRAFTKYVLESEAYLLGIRGFIDFIETVDMEEITKYFLFLLNKNNLSASTKSIDSILIHLRVLMYRATQENFISELGDNMSTIQKPYHEIAKSLVSWVEEEYQITLPKIEEIFLASQISGKTSAGQVPEEEEEAIVNRIVSVLEKIDAEFFTAFSKDEILKDALLLHMYPLLKRIAFKMELANPLVEDVSSRYANVFLVALRFSEVWEQDDSFSLSRDEIGYLALHFASYLERRRQEVLSKVKRIAVVSGTGGGSAFLLQTKLEEAFPKSVITNIPLTSVIDLRDEHVDLILSTVDIGIQMADEKIPIIFIKNLLDDTEIRRIKEILIGKEYSESDNITIFDLFSEQFFSVQPEQTSDYLATIESMAKMMVESGDADANFVHSVLEREKKFSTIYQNGVAGPHSMTLNAIRNSIGVEILKKPLVYNGKEVKIIFLINIRNGNLFLYREISKFLLRIMNDAKAVEEIRKIKSFKDFQLFLKKIG